MYQGDMVFDIETNGLALEDINTIHTMTIYDYSTGAFTRYDKEDVRLGVEHLQRADRIVGHNIINYDIPVIQKFFPWFTPKEVIDTIVWARLVFPDMVDTDMQLVHRGILPRSLVSSHSLKAYGYRLGELKGDFHETTDWQEWTPEMSEYCEQDVRVTKLLYEKLISIGVSEESLDLEHKVAKIIKRQMDYGFLFNVKEGESLYLQLLEQREELHKQLLEVFGWWYEPNGKPRVSKVNNKTRGISEGAYYQNLKIVEFNPNSRQHIAKRLIKKYNWKPKEFTAGGQPKVDESVLESLQYPEAKLMSEYLLVQKRISQLAEGESAWLKLVKPDGRIYGSVITNGAVTGRMTHNSPNIAQVPKVGVPYGENCRGLFIVPSGKVLVGADASGLELRCLAHYMARYDGGAYGKEILEGDIHTANQRSAGLPTRDNAKTFIYAFLYGAGDEKIGSIVGAGRREGRKLRNKFLKQTPALAQLKRQVEYTAKTRGYLIGLDGRPLKVRSLHSALNTLLQSAGAIIMKKALVILDETLQGDLEFVPGVDYEFVANIHDEFQVETKIEYGDLVGQKAVESIRLAGESFGFRCALDGEYKIGKTWAETH